MQVRFALQSLEKSIFLAGPTPRSSKVASWRPEALKLLTELGFNGTVYVPEAMDWGPHSQYTEQLHWEWEGLNQATVVIFWVPRNIRTLPAFTTNIEFGNLVSSGKALMGYPKEAEKMKYLDALARRHHVPVMHSLRELLSAAIARTQRPFGATR
jgi:nucleoside 2-deoxyribosyltransferase